jgi:hypothetical protein
VQPARVNDLRDERAHPGMHSEAAFQEHPTVFGDRGCTREEVFENGHAAPLWMHALGHLRKLKWVGSGVPRV